MIGYEHRQIRGGSKRGVPEEEIILIFRLISGVFSAGKILHKTLHKEQKSTNPLK